MSVVLCRSTEVRVDDCLCSCGQRAGGQVTLLQSYVLGLHHTM